MSELLIRRASPNEAEVLAEVFLAARKSILHIVPFVHPEDSVPGYIRDMLAPKAALWTAEMDGRVVALMALAPGWVEQLYVHPDFHSRGIGTELLLRAKNTPEAENGLTLWTFQGNVGARRFYERHGFAAVEFTDGADNDEKTPDVRYLWRPPAPLVIDDD